MKSIYLLLGGLLWVAITHAQNTQQFKNSVQDNVAQFFPDLVDEFANFNSKQYHSAEWARRFVGSQLHNDNTFISTKSVICNDTEKQNTPAVFDLVNCRTYWKIPLAGMNIRALMPPDRPVYAYHFFMNKRGKLYTNGKSITRCSGVGFFPVQDQTVLSYFSLILHPDGPILLTPAVNDPADIYVWVTRLE